MKKILRAQCTLRLEAQLVVVKWDALQKIN